MDVWYYLDAVAAVMLLTLPMWLLLLAGIVVDLVRDRKQWGRGS